MRNVIDFLVRDRFSPAAAGWALTVLRITFPLILLFAHGLAKVQNWPQMSQQFAEILPIGPAGNLALAIFAEVFCAALIALGLFTRLAAIPLVIHFSVIVLVVHADDPFSRKELPLLFGIGFLALLIGGGGRFSLGRLLFRDRAAPAARRRP